MNKKYKIQVDRSLYYGNKYFTKERFISYYHQLYFIASAKPEKILEIGIGDKTVSNYLKTAGFDVVTCDFDEKLDPDIVCDIRSLPFQNEEFDTVVAFEVLEHLPYEDFECSLKEIHRSTSKTVIISLPYNCSYFNFNFLLSLHLKGRVIKKRKEVLLKYPNFYKNIDINENGQHYWEVGAKGYSKKKVMKCISSFFIIKKVFQSPSSPYHLFFVLEKK